MSQIKANNFMPRSLSDPPPEDEMCLFTQEQMRDFKETAKFNEMKAFEKIVMQTSEKDLSNQDKEIIREELKTQNNMILMIFRFFLQSGEYSFFIKRLKNVVMTKISLKQLRTNETMLNSRKEDKNFTIDQKNDDMRDNQPEQSKTNKLNGSSQSASKPYGMFQTPQKHSNKAQVNSLMNSNDLDKANAYQASYNNSSAQQSSMKDYDKTYSRRDASQQPQYRQPLIPKNNVLNQKDLFQFKQVKCIKGKSPKKFKHQRVMTFGAALVSLQNIGIDVSQMRDYMQDQVQERIGPSLKFKEISEASGGYTPPLQMQSDSEGGQELTPTRVETDYKFSKPVIQSLYPQLANRKDDYENVPEDKDSIFHNVDVQYVMNILRHQASKNHNKIEEEDLSLCLSIVCRSQHSNGKIQGQVKELFDEIVQSEEKKKRLVNKGQQRWLYFEEVLGPLAIKNLLCTSDGRNVEVFAQKAFESFRLQFGMKFIPFEDFKRFIITIFEYLTLKIKSEKRTIAHSIEMVAKEYVNHKGLQFEDGISKVDIEKWIKSELIGNQTSYLQQVQAMNTKFSQQSLENSQISIKQDTYRRTPNLMSLNIQSEENPVYRPNTANLVSHQFTKDLTPSKNLEVYKHPNGSSSYSNYSQDQRAAQIQGESLDYQAMGMNNNSGAKFNQSRFKDSPQKSQTQLQPSQKSQLSISQLNENYQQQPLMAQRTYTQGFTTGKMQALNQSSGNIGSGAIYSKQQQMFRMSDGFQYSQQYQQQHQQQQPQVKNDNIYKLKPQIIKEGKEGGLNGSYHRY